MFGNKFTFPFNLLVAQDDTNYILVSKTLSLVEVLSQKKNFAQNWVTLFYGLFDIKI